MTDHNAIILSIIKSRPDFDNTINQHDIADECMSRSGEHITARVVRRIIEELIEQGYPIISTPHNPGGYCWGSKDDEALECYKRLRRKGIKVLVRARKVYRNCKIEKARRAKIVQEQMKIPYRTLARVG